MSVKEWIHHLLNPHCTLCEEKELEKKVCKSCEVLKQQLDRSNHQFQTLLNSLIDSQKPPIELPEMKPITPKYIPWSVKKQMLEAESRKQAEILKAKNEELEKELGLNNAS